MTENDANTILRSLLPPVECEPDPSPEETVYLHLVTEYLRQLGRVPAYSDRHPLYWSTPNQTIRVHTTGLVQAARDQSLIEFPPGRNEVDLLRLMNHPFPGWSSPNPRQGRRFRELPRSRSAAILAELGISTPTTARPPASPSLVGQPRPIPQPVPIENQDPTKEYLGGYEVRR